MKEKITQKELIKKFFINNPLRDIKHPEVVDWAVKEWQKLTGNILRDPDRQIRSLHQEGFLEKKSKGIYRYNPDLVENRELEYFTDKQKKEILKRDGYKCVICGRGKKDGIELHIDHIKPKDHGGKATIENGQTLCSQHNFMKKNFKQTETGKKMFIRLYDLAKKQDNKSLLKFCKEVLDVFEKNNINGHIKWKK